MLSNKLPRAETKLAIVARDIVPAWVYVLIVIAVVIAAGYYYYTKRKEGT